MYLQVALQEGNAVSGIPEYLRILVKPIADYAVGGHDPANVKRGALLAAGGGLLRRDIVFIQGELGKCECTKAKGKDEPYATMLAQLPKDEPKKSRYELLRQGDGHTLIEIAEMQESIGTCSCEGRRNAVKDPQRAHVKGVLFGADISL